MIWEMLFEEFQDGRHGGRLGYLNGTILAVLNLCVTVMLSIKFGRRCRLKNFMVVILDTERNNYRNISRWPPWISDRTILAILNLYNSSKPLINFQLNLTYCLGLDVV